MGTVSLADISCELVAGLANGNQAHLAGVTEDLSWSEQSGEYPVRVNATLFNAVLSDGSHLWDNLGLGSHLQINASWDGGRTINQPWTGMIEELYLADTGAQRIKIVAYDPLKQLVTDQRYYIKQRGIPANQWVQAVLDDQDASGVPHGAISAPTTPIRQYTFTGQPRAKIIDDILRWAFYRSGPQDDGSPSTPQQLPYFLRFRAGQAEVVAPGSNTDLYLFTPDACAYFEDHRSLQNLVTEVDFYSTAALTAGASATPNPFPQAIWPPAGPVQGFSGNPIPQRRQVLSVDGDNYLIAAQQAQDILAVWSKPWLVKTIQVMFCPWVRRGDADFFAIDDMVYDPSHPWAYVVTGVVHDWTHRLSILTVDSLGVLGSLVTTQNVLLPLGSTSTDQQNGATVQPPGSGATAPGAPSQAMGPLGTFTSGLAMEPGIDTENESGWNCSAAASAWALRSMGIPATWQDIVHSMYPGWDGGADEPPGFGGGPAMSTLATAIGTLYNVTVKEPLTTSDITSLAGQVPIVFNGTPGSFWPEGHFVGVRSADTSGNISLANPTGGATYGQTVLAPAQYAIPPNAAFAIIPNPS